MPETPRPQHHPQSQVPEVPETLAVAVREVRLPETIQPRKASQFSTEQRLVLVSFREVDECYISRCRI